MTSHQKEKSDISIDLSRTDLILNKFESKRDTLISILLEIQEERSYLPKESLVRVAEKLNIPLIEVYGIASFYKVFSFTPRGEHLIMVCLGTACHVRGGSGIVEAIQNSLHIAPGETTPNKKFTLETVRCLGACALGPIMVVDGNYHGKMTPKKVEKILSKY